MTTAFGQIVVATQVEYAVRDILRKYFPTYLREVERQVGWEGDTLPEPRNYENRNSFDILPGEEMPKVVVISPGLFEIPSHPEADGTYDAKWQVGVGIAVAGRTEEESDRMVKMYGAAARAAVVQHQDLEGATPEIVGVDWLDENYEDLAMDDQFMNYKAASIWVAVHVKQTVNRFMRPPDVSEEEQVIEDVEQVVINVDGYKETVIPHG